jgi:hypothetical protein
MLHAFVGLLCSNASAGHGRAQRLYALLAMLRPFLAMLCLFPGTLHPFFGMLCPFFGMLCLVLAMLHPFATTLYPWVGLLYPKATIRLVCARTLYLCLGLLSPKVAMLHLHVATLRSGRWALSEGGRECDQRSALCLLCALERGSAASPQAVQHGRDAIEPRFALLDVSRVDVAPSNGHPQRRTRLGVGTCGGAEACDPMATLTAIALGHVERHGTERSSKLVGEVSVVAPDAGDDGSQDSDGFDREFEDLKRRELRLGL